MPAVLAAAGRLAPAALALTATVATLAATAGAAGAQGGTRTTRRTTTVTTVTTQPAADSGALIVRLGTDTIAAERWVRAGDRMEGELVNRAPSVRVTRYTATLDPQGRVARVELRTRRPDGTPVAGVALGSVMTFRGDSALAEVQLPDSTRRFAVAGAAGAVPAIGNSYAMWEVALGALRAAGRDSGALVLWAPGAPQAASLPVRLFGTDSARVTYFGDPVAVRLDRRGRIIAVDGSRSTNKVTVTRVPALDVAAMAGAMAARPAMAQASPRDTVRATVGGAQLLVDYGRPSRRGRTVWGGALVPHGQIWRTGANAATQLRTSADLVIGGATVPAGTYTLFTWPTAEGYQLVINRQTGQWGTEYDAAQDLARVPLAATTLGNPMEQFTIAIEPTGGAGGQLVLRWDALQLATPFTVR